MSKERNVNLRGWCKTENISDFQSDDRGSNPLPRITFDLVDTELKRSIFKQIVVEYHTYKPSVDLLGRQINWLIKNNGEVIGVIGLGSSVMSMKPRDDFIGWNKEQRIKNLTKTATNWRYCLKESSKGLTSQILSLLGREGQKEWFRKYGQKLVLLDTLVEPPYTGISYKASGWILVGETKGLQFQWKSMGEILPTDKVFQKFMLIDGVKDVTQWKVVTGTTKKKLIFVKPLHRYWKKELLRTEETKDVIERKNK